MFFNLFKLLGSSTLAQLLLVLISPILSRIYKPEIFGIFVTLISIVYIINSFSQARMNVAIFSSKDEKEVSTIFSLGIVFIFITVIGTFITLLILDSIYFIEVYFYLIPIMVLSLSFYQLLISLFIKSDKINLVSKNRLIQGLILGFSQILFGLINPTVYALAIAQAFSFFLTSVFNLASLKNVIRFFNPIPYFKKYKDFIIYDTGGNFFQILSHNIAPIFITSILGNYLGGIYYMAYRILITPVSIFSVSVSQIISGKFNNSADWSKQNNHALQILLFIFCIPFAILSSYIEYLVPLMFGAEWSDTGIIIRYFSTWIFLRLIYDSFSIHFSLNNRSKDKIILDATLLIYMLTVFYVLKIMNVVGLDYLIRFAYLNTIIYVFAIYFLSYKNSFEACKNLIYTILCSLFIYLYPFVENLYLTLVIVLMYIFVLVLFYKKYKGQYDKKPYFS